MPGQTLPASNWSAYSWDLMELTQGTPWRADRRILVSGAQTAGHLDEKLGTRHQVSRQRPYVAHPLGDRGPGYVLRSTVVPREVYWTIKPRVVAWQYEVQMRDETKKRKRQDMQRNQ